MQEKKLIYTLSVVIWLLVIALWICIYSHKSSLFPWEWIYWWDWAMRRFSSWANMWPRWGRMWSWVINNFSSADKAIIDELKKARESWDKDKERELMDKLRNGKINNTGTTK